MNDRQKAYWQKATARGIWWYALKWGLITGIAMVAILLIGSTFIWRSDVRIGIEGYVILFVFGFLIGSIGALAEWIGYKIS